MVNFWDGQFPGQTIKVAEGEYVIGRLLEAASHVEIIGRMVSLNDVRISPRHGRLTLKGGHILYRDDSTFGTYLNGKNVLGRTVQIFPGDELTFGNNQLYVVTIQSNPDKRGYAAPWLSPN